MCLEILWHKKKTLLWIGASLRLYTDVFEDLIIFGTILYSLCLLYLFHATLINSYMLYSFQPFHPQFFRCSAFSGPPYILDKWFLLSLSWFFYIILFFALVLNTVDIALVKFSFWQFKSDDWIYIFYYLT